MKIKTVCEMTGLTDRAIRHYIEECLLQPSFTENYLGRRTFDFSDADVERLKEIAILRKFDFSVHEIRQMLTDSRTIIPIVEVLKNRKTTSLQEETVLLQRLSQIQTSEMRTVSDLAAFLAMPVKEKTVPPDHNHYPSSKTLGKFIKNSLCILVALLPIVIVSILLVDGFRKFYYPVFSKVAVFLSVLSLIPSLLFFLTHVITKKDKWRKIIKGFAICLCAYSFFLSFSGEYIIHHSETNEIAHYRREDAACIVGKEPFYQELFPPYAHDMDVDENGNRVIVDANYHYRFSAGTYDVYAEWPLKESAFEQEIERVHGLFARQDHQTITKGKYTCLVYSPYSKSEPFEKVSANYTFYIFAYNREDLRVRYITCGSVDAGLYQPYYLTLDW